MNVPDKMFQSHSWLDINIYMFVKRNTTDGVVKVSLQQIADEFGTTRGKANWVLKKLYTERWLTNSQQTANKQLTNSISSCGQQVTWGQQTVNKQSTNSQQTTANEINTTNITAAFDGWLAQNCPYIYAHYKLLSGDELTKLKEQYSSWQIADTCRQIENRKDLRKKYTNLYMTLLNWLKRDENGTNRTDTEQRNAEAARTIAAFLADD